MPKKKKRKNKKSPKKAVLDSSNSAIEKLAEADQDGLLASLEDAIHTSLSVHEPSVDNSQIEEQRESIKQVHQINCQLRTQCELLNSAVKTSEEMQYEIETRLKEFEREWQLVRNQNAHLRKQIHQGQQVEKTLLETRKLSCAENDLQSAKLASLLDSVEIKEEQCKSLTQKNKLLQVSHRELQLKLDNLRNNETNEMSEVDGISSDDANKHHESEYLAKLLNFFMNPVETRHLPVMIINHQARGMTLFSINQYHQKTLITLALSQSLDNLISKNSALFSVYLYGSALPFSPYQSLIPDDMDFAVLFDPSETIEDAFHCFVEILKATMESDSCRINVQPDFCHVIVDFECGSLEFTVYNQTLKQVMLLSPINQVFCRLQASLVGELLCLGSRWDWKSSLLRLGDAIPEIGVVNKDWFKFTLRDGDRVNYKKIIILVKQLSRTHSAGYSLKWEVCACLHMMLEAMQLPRSDRDKSFFINTLRLRQPEQASTNVGNPQTVSQPVHKKTIRNLIRQQNADFILFLRKSVPVSRRGVVGPRLDFFSSMLPQPANNSPQKTSYASVLKKIIFQ